MKIKKILKLNLIFLMIMFFSLASGAQVVVIKKPEVPKVVFAKKPQPGPNYFWIKPYWQWNKTSSRYIWVEGYWEKRRKNQSYVPGHWIKTRRGAKWVPGHWKYRNSK
ncbi:MAG: BcpO-related WXXGXW repeat protein [Chlorobi bacterium]|nr:BcpO-related WXXGXW repeat protein [Chlorobiota bacterium]